MVQQYKNQTKYFEALDVQFRILPLSEKLFGEDRYTLRKIHDIGKVEGNLREYDIALE